MRLTHAAAQPLAFLKLLAHDIRWRILVALVKSDYRVNELVELIKQPPNLISYHLKRLRLKQLVSERRSSADSRDIYYSLNLDHFRKMYFETGQALHPALGTQPASETKTVMNNPVRVLFLCTHNSARSQMAEGLLSELSRNKIEVFSAGSEPTNIHPLAIKVMSSRGIDLRNHRAKHLDEFVGQKFDYVITVCDRVREVCPVFPGDPQQIHWSFPDPVAVEGNQQIKERGFEDTARELTNRIQYLLLMIDRSRKE
jgi:ArsR family transcriptional regulator, arsenate/arsenite/antimonite-responsive transcriptional repressor / arsenate reductase (thioredoxin)